MFFLSLFILGFTSLVAQIVMTRELIVSFYGNEFFIGWLLFGWLFWVGVGSLIIKFLGKPYRGLPLLISCNLLIALLVPLTIFWIRLSKGLFTGAAGQIPDLMPAVMVSFFAVSPLCLVFGAQFMVASESLFVIPAQAGIYINLAYFYEALGFVVGGLVFSYGLVFLNEFQVSAILIILNLTAVLILLFFEKLRVRKYFFIAAMLTACLGLICSVFSGQLNIRTTAFRFPNAQLMETKNSIYGNLALTRTGHQLNFYESGLVLGTDKDEAFNEYMVHFPMLSDDNPQKVLLIGSGFSGALQEILKYGPKQIFYAELDPAIIDLVRAHIPAFGRMLDGGRIILIKEDPRISLKSLPTDLDVVIINLPNPSTTLINRYFTDDFFKEVRRHLKVNGVVSTHLVFAADSISEPLGNLGSCLYKTIQRNFSSVVVLPEDVLFILASPSPLIHDPQVLIQRLQDRGIHNYFVNGPAIVYRYTTDRVKQTTDIFKSNKTVRINYDLHPQGYIYNLIYWLSIFHQGASAVISSIMRTNYFFILFLGICLILLLPFVIGQPVSLRAKRSNLNFPIFAMAIGGGSLMSAEVIVIYGFQVFYGNLYYKIAWIVSAFMAATAAGAFWGNKQKGDTLKCPLFPKLVKLHAGIGIYFVLWLLLIWSAAQLKWALPPDLWIIVGAGIGILIGWEFSWISRSHPGTIYAADLLGSCLGALGISVFMIPVYGVYQTLLFLMIINITLAFVILKKGTL